jgi:hypothetical protein
MKAEYPNEVARSDCSTAGAVTVVLVCGVFVLYSFCHVPIPGVNESHYLCKARALYDSHWCVHDQFLHSANAHLVFFALFGAAAKILPLAVVAIVGRIISLALLGVAWATLGRRLSLSPSGIVVAACCYCGVAMTGNFSGEWVIGGLEGKVPSYGFALLAISIWLDAWKSGSRRLYVISGAFGGLSVAFHPVVGLWFCIGIALSEVWMSAVSGSRGDSVPRRTEILWVQDGLAFSATAFVISLPGLVPVLSLLTQGDVTGSESDRANYIQVFWRLAHHLDPSTFPVQAWIHTLVLIFVCILGIWGLRTWQGQSSRSTAWRPWLTLLAASAVFAVAGVVVGWHSGAASDMPDWQRRAVVLKFYPFRLFDALLPMTTALLFGGLMDVAVRRRADRHAIEERLSVDLGDRRLRQRENRKPGSAALVSVCLVIVLSLWQRTPAPGGYSPKQFVDWKSACDWIRLNTPPDSQVFTPRESFAFKWFAERAEYVCIKDCPQDAAGILEWNQRLWRIHDWSRESFQDGRFDDADLERLRSITGASYILTRRLGPFESTPVFRNDTWRVYAAAEAEIALW